MQHILDNISQGTLPFMLDPAQARWVAWSLYGDLRIACGPSVPFAALTPAHCGNPISAAQLSILREMERSRVWQETEEAKNQWRQWIDAGGSSGTDGTGRN